MREISLEEQKRMGFDTLSYFADFCESHGLRYFLAYGTLLGAVRHGGFIPWDDDIDVWMPRRDYDQLLAYKDEVDASLYELNAIETNALCWLPFGKLSRKDTVILPSPFLNNYVRRLSIDIFPLDYFTASDDEAIASAEYVRFWESETRIVRRYRHSIGTSAGLKRFVKRIAYRGACLRYGDITPRIRVWARMLADCPPQKQENARYLVSPEELFLYKKEWFQESVKLEFETGRFDAPSNYDAVLRVAYGDYMTPPPEKERKLPHTGKTYCVDG